jgi:hypothetical protein
MSTSTKTWEEASPKWLRSAKRYCDEALGYAWQGQPKRRTSTRKKANPRSVNRGRSLNH